jgi:hypothetical protein
MSSPYLTYSTPREFYPRKNFYPVGYVSPILHLHSKPTIASPVLA